MAEIRETSLPGVGVRVEFTTEAGEQIGAIVHRGGRRELLVYDGDDPDRCTTLLTMTEDEARTLGEILGVPPVSKIKAAIQHDIEGLAIDWLPVAEGSPFAGRTIGEGMLRSRTGVSIVAVVRGADTVPAPGADFEFAAGDVAVAGGTPEGIEQVRAMFTA